MSWSSFGNNLATSSNVSINGHVTATSMTINALNLGGTIQNFNVNGKLRENGNDLIPRGIITMWSGDTPPAGWILCDGQNGTPDLRGRFILGYNRNIDENNIVGTARLGRNTVGRTGGKFEHTLTTDEIPSHKHNGTTNDNGYWGFILPPQSYDITGIINRSSGSTLIDRNNRTVKNNWIHNHSFETNSVGGSQPHSIVPPYYVLAFIMKV
jgi:microcystin-dependent protein